MGSLPLVLYVISEWVVRLIMLVVVTRRKRPVSAMAWLLIIFFQPWIGLGLYIILGRYRLTYRRSRQHRQNLKNLRRIEKHTRSPITPQHPDFGPDIKPLIAVAEKLCNMPVMGANSAQLFTYAQQAIDSMIEDIKQAKKHINLLFYIYSDDSTARLVTDALIEAAKRGVKVKVLVDAAGSMDMLNNQAGEMRRNGIQVQEALGVGTIRRRLARIDIRNHRKLLIIDGKIAYGGSQNITEPTYGTRKLIWRDIMVRITGPAVMELQVVFSEDWHFETGQILATEEYFPEPSKCGDVSIQALPSGPNYPTENYQRIVIAAIHNAREQIVITTPYFVPDEASYQAMQIAILKGVRIDLIVPKKSDMPVVDFVARAYFRDLLNIGVNIHLYNNGLLHSKTMCVDNTLAFIGSSNFDIRSFKLNFELNLIFYGPQVAGVLSNLHRQYLNDCDEISRKEWSQRSIIKTTAQNIAKLLSPVL